MDRLNLALIEAQLRNQIGARGDGCVFYACDNLQELFRVYLSGRQGDSERFRDAIELLRQYLVV